jgi:two-component system cell cycle sensor histidine kinase/response regulator CckA
VASIANSNRGLILVVEDEVSILRGATLAVAKSGFRAIIVENGAAGLEEFLSHADEIDLVLADVVMPIMDGITMVQEIRKARPDVRVLLMTGYLDKIVTPIDGAQFRFIRKPFLIEDLVRAISAVLDPLQKAKGRGAR